MEFIGYVFALLVGILLGLVGGGGSILTVPVLVYALSVNPVLATAYSLFIVGASSFVGALNYLKKGLVSVRTAIIFTIPALIAVYATRRYLIPAIPDELVTVSNYTLTKDVAIMILFGIIMLFAALSMIRNNKKDGNGDEEGEQEIQYNYPMIALEGTLVGVLTGLVGAGGGFLIIPALVLFARLPMKLAVGTSLFIISIKSLIGFLGDVQTGQEIDWPFLLIFTSLSIFGIFVGSYLSNFVNNAQLKKGFGWFVLIMAIFIVVKELSV